MSQLTRGPSGSTTSSKKKGSITPSSSGSSQDLKNDSTNRYADKGDSSKNVRSGGAISSGTGKVKKTDSTSTPGSSDRANESKISETSMSDRTLWVLMHLIGKFVEVQVKSGEVYEGMFYTATTEKGLGVLLKMAKKKDKDGQGQGKDKARPIENFLIFPGDFVQLSAKDVPLEIRNEREFGTDTDISGHSGGRTRELQRWVPDSAPSDSDLSLEGDHQGWDQFRANREKFGVETSWDERYYTTEIDKSSDNYRQRSAAADRIAAEIERSSKGSSNFHLAEERGMEVDVNEEDLYGAVIRQPIPQSTSGKYVPPHQRGKASSTKGSEEAKPEEKPQPVKESTPASSTSTAAVPTKEVKPSTTAPSTASRTLKSRENSVEDLNEAGVLSPRLQSGTASPLRTQRDKERLQLRLSVVSESLKNSAPIQNNEFSTTPNRSPLHSPLIGNPASINALSLEVTTPKPSEEELEEFLKFTLDKKPKTQREKELAKLKDFSSNFKIDNRIPKVGSKAPSKTATGSAPEANKAGESGAKPAEKTEKKIEEKSTEKKVEEKSTAAPVSEKTEGAAKEEDKKNPDGKSKLNPNAKAFKPMSASAPSFTPSATSTTPAPAPAPAPVAQVPMLIPEFSMYNPNDPNAYYRTMAAYPMAYQPIIPNQMMYPGVRIVGPPVYPYPQQLVYGPNGAPAIVQGAAPIATNAAATTPPAPLDATQGNSKKFTKTPSGQAPVSPSSSGSFQGGYAPNAQRMMAPQYFPAQFGQPMVVAAVPAPFYPPQMDQQGQVVMQPHGGAKEEPKFQGVPNTDKQQ